MTSHFGTLFAANKKIKDFMEFLINEELANTSKYCEKESSDNFHLANATTLFRGNSMTSKFMTSYAKSAGLEYLKKIVKVKVPLMIN